MFAHHAHHEGAQGTVYTRTCPRLPPHPRPRHRCHFCNLHFSNRFKTISPTNRPRKGYAFPVPRNLPAFLRSIRFHVYRCISRKPRKHVPTRNTVRSARNFLAISSGAGFRSHVENNASPSSLSLSLFLLLRDEQLSRQFPQLPSSFLNRSFSRNFRHLSSSGIEGFSSFVEI